MKIYQAPVTEITRLNLVHGVMQGDDNVNFGDAVSVDGGVIQTNIDNVFDEEDTAFSPHTSLWDD